MATNARTPDPRIMEYARDGSQLRLRFFEQNSAAIHESALKTALAMSLGHKLLICGNGGSAADAQHVAGEFVNRFLFDRPALPAIALTTDSSVLTAIANDSSFDQVFARQVAALGQEGDVLLAISTSGNSPNALNAIYAAKDKGLLTIGLTGRNGGKMQDLCSINITTDCARTPLIQELHLAFEHLYCALIENFLFQDPGVLAPYLSPTAEKD